MPSAWQAGGGSSGPGRLAAILIGAALLAFVWFFVFPVLLFVGELLLLLVIAAGGIAVKVLFRRPWKIEARTLGPLFEEHTFAVVGVRASSEAVDTVAAAIQRGTPAGDIRLAPDEFRPDEESRPPCPLISDPQPPGWRD